MALQQWELYESMSVLKDSGTTTTGQRGAADGCHDVQIATGIRSAAATTNGGGNNGRQSAEDPQRSAAKKRPAAANGRVNAFPAQANSIERRVTKKINIIKENRNDDGRGEDESQQFLLSLLPYLRDVPKHRKLTVRHKLQKVFIDELEEHGDQPPPPPPPPPPTPTPAARGPPPPYPHKYVFGGYVPPQRVSAAAGKHTQPAAGKCASDVPLLNFDYSTSMTPTVYCNGKAFAASHVASSAVHDVLCYGRSNHYATSTADATPTSAHAGFSDSYTTTVVTVNPADVTDDKPWTYCNV